jgi:hypothetical protein
MGVRYEIRQQVGTARRMWFKAFRAGEHEQPARKQYEALVRAHPDAYFELVRSTTIEERLACTPIASCPSLLDNGVSHAA